MNRGTQEAPFSRYNKLAKKKAVAKPVATAQPQTYPNQYNGSYVKPKPFVAPELEGMKHTAGGSRGGERGGRGGFEVEGRRPEMQPRPTLTPEAIEGSGVQVAQPTRMLPPQSETPQIQIGMPGGGSDPVVRTGEENTIGGGFSEETAPEWGTEDYQQGMYNLAREQISGQTAADTEYARTELGGRGFRAGESGIANRALMNIRRKGAETLGTESRKMAMQGMGARYGQQQDLMNMIMNKYGIDTAAQQRRFDPYYDVEQQYAGTA